MKVPLPNNLVSTLENLEKNCFARPWNAEQIASTLEQERSFVCLQDPSGAFWSSWISFADRVLLGKELHTEFWAVAYILLSQADAQGPVDLYRIGVLPDFRQRGLGEQLLCFALEEVKQGIGSPCRILLEVDAGNASALALYTKQGFREIHRRRNYYGTNDALVLEKTIL